MPISDQLDSVIQRALGDVFEAHLPALRAEISRRVSEQLGPAAPVSNHAGIPQIASAVQAIQSATTQTDVLVALLNGATEFASRAALFVVRAGNAIGWQARGMDDNVLKALHLSTEQGTIARVTRDAATVRVGAREFDPSFSSAMGIAGEQECVAVPLIVKDRVAALMYADAGQNGGTVDSAALEILVRSAALWLEVLTTRKAVAATAASHPTSSSTEAMTTAEKVVEAVSAASSSVPAVAEPPVVAQGLPAVAPAVPSAVVPPVVPTPASAEAAPQDQEIHNKAKRFAKLLVDEIKLYNQEKVAQGKQNKNLYDVLRDDIDKSRATYEKRYSSTAAAAGNYFNKELIRALVDNDASLLGSNYPG
jgi:hypothetical protein